MQNTSLVIMAAGLGTRYGKGIKQLIPVGPGGELIIDYSIRDALEAGFDRVIFIIRKDLERGFKETVGKRTESLCRVDYVFQELDEIPEGFSVPEGRRKPWGTGQALLLCRGVVNEPFVVINSDDYYGKEAFVKIHDFLLEHAGSRHCYCMAGFVLRNTLSDNGSVTRGICHVDEENFLTDIVETYKIVRSSGGVMTEVTGEALDPDAFVSMNMWGLTPEFLDMLDRGFSTFLAGVKPGDLTAEYLLPSIIGGMLRWGAVKVRLLETHDKWHGVTYVGDLASVQAAFADFAERGIYPSQLV